MPQDRKYTNCVIKFKSREMSFSLGFIELKNSPENNQVMQLVMMFDPIYMCLFSKDSFDNVEIKGFLRLKIFV